MPRRDRSPERDLPADNRATSRGRPLALHLTMVVLLVVPLVVAGVAAIVGRSSTSVDLASSPLDAQPVRASFESTGAPRSSFWDDVASTSTSSSTSTPASTVPATTATTAPAPTTTAPPVRPSTTVTTTAPATTTTVRAPAPTQVQALAPPPTAAPPPPPVITSVGNGNEAAILACIRRRESGGNYSINTGNGYYGAYQFHQATWDSVARSAGRPDLVGQRPSSASPADQDAMALALLRSSGLGPWGGHCP